MNFKKKYYHHLIEGRSKNLENILKEKMADREFKTFIFLLSNFFDENFSKNSEQINVLDLGCGDQLIKKPFEKNNFFYKGLDIQDLDIEKDNFPIEDNSIDIIISVGLIEALKTTENLFKESLRVLKKGGYIYLITPNWLKDYKNFYRNPFHKKPFTPDSLENILHLSGFQDIKTFPGLRCKPKWYYQGKYRFEKAYYLLPFSGVNFINHESKVIDNKWIPDFLKGHARSIIAVAKK